MLYMALLRVMPSHYRVVSVANMRGKVQDKRQKWVGERVMQDGVMTSKFHNVSVHNFLAEWPDLWKDAYSRDACYFGGFGTLQ